MLYGNKNSLSLRKVGLQIPSFKTESWEIFAGRRMLLGEANGLAMGTIDKLSTFPPSYHWQCLSHSNCSQILEQ